MSGWKSILLFFAVLLGIALGMGFAIGYLQAIGVLSKAAATILSLVCGVGWGYWFSTYWEQTKGF